MSAVSLNFKKLGDGEPLFILHGLFGSLDNWQTLANELMKNYTVYLIDLRNHGKSAHTSSMTYPLMSEDIQLLMNEEKLNTIHLVGHSMGGKVCYQLLKDCPERIKKAMIVDMSPKTYKSTHEEIFKAMLAIDLERLVKRSDAELILQEFIKEPSIRQFILKNLERLPDNRFEWRINLNVLYKDYDRICEEIIFNRDCDVPIRILSGSLSRYVVEEDIVHLNNYFNSLSWITIKNAGHWVHADKPKETVEEIIKFF